LRYYCRRIPDTSTHARAQHKMADALRRIAVTFFDRTAFSISSSRSQQQWSSSSSAAAVARGHSDGRTYLTRVFVCVRACRVVGAIKRHSRLGTEYRRQLKTIGRKRRNNGKEHTHTHTRPASRTEKYAIGTYCVCILLRRMLNVRTPWTCFRHVLCLCYDDEAPVRQYIGRARAIHVLPYAH